MYRINTENIFCFDVDGTLISFRRSHKAPGDEHVVNPYTKETVYFKPIHAHIDLLKESHGRGRFIIVWSAAGIKWAEVIIQHLKLEQYVDIVATKPYGYCDDKEASEWMNNRVFLKPEERS